MTKVNPLDPQYRERVIKNLSRYPEFVNLYYKLETDELRNEFIVVCHTLTLAWYAAGQESFINAG